MWYSHSDVRTCVFVRSHSSLLVGAVLLCYFAFFWVKNVRLYQHAAEGLYSGRKSLSHRFVMCGTSTWITCMLGGGEDSIQKCWMMSGFCLWRIFIRPPLWNPVPSFNHVVFSVYSPNKLEQQVTVACAFLVFFGETNLFLDLMHGNGEYDVNFWVLLMSTIKILTHHQGLGMWFPSFNKSWDDVG